MRYILLTIGLLTLAACAPQIPDSGAGVGFNNYDSYQTRREAELSGQTVSPVPAGTPLSTETVGGPEGGAGTEPPVTTASAPPPVTTRPAGISDEQDFSVVSERETIESDAARIAASREVYQQIEPTALPTRSGGNGASIVTYALNTTNQVGQAIYRRSTLFAEDRFNRNCGKYASADLAQEAFLAAGGPERDRRGIDPDGDGFACYWDPAPFRQARAATPQVPETASR